ncbi:MAG: T9SS type A sorting domain-containing protein, partial [Saprospiraceae bacterium]|nr:T9SS type A sorting domain-containing protein [Saprospiraceae bacterium]
LGQAHCSEAHIYPDTTCGVTWLGPELVLNANCTLDSAFFELINVGGAMGIPLNYYVFEGDLMIYQDPFLLGAGGILNVTIPISQGQTYRFSTEPISNYPPQLGDGFVTKALENCNPIPGSIITTSYVLSQYNGNSASSISIDCQQNVFAYDPNDKNAQPEGYGTQHYIEANTPLDYKIRFQNTGNDTAFTVVIKDTLSPYLDLSSLQMGVSSHVYTWSLNGNILSIHFDNIMLPDSNINEPASNGFVSYTIRQVADLPLETRIENTAYIYFDFNPAIITNTTFHTIGEDFFDIQLIETSVSEVGNKTPVAYKLFPNPTQDKIFVQSVSNTAFEAQLYDLNGRLLGSYSFDQLENGISLKPYPSGNYILKIANSKQINTYKITKLQ